MDMPLQLTPSIEIVFLSGWAFENSGTRAMASPSPKRKTPGSFLPGVFVSESRNLRRW